MKNTIKKIFKSTMVLTLVSSLVMGLAGCSATDNGGLDGNKDDSTFYLAINVNPSVELVGEDGIIQSVSGLNKEGALIAASIQEAVIGKTAEEASVIVVEKINSLGYLENSNDVELIASGENVSVEKAIADVVEKNVTKFLETSGIDSAVVVEKETTSELKKLSEKYDITVGKMNFIEKAIQKDPTLEIKDLVTMKTSDINKLASGYDKVEMDTFITDLGKKTAKHKNMLEEKEAALEAEFDILENQLDVIENLGEKMKTEEEFQNFKSELESFMIANENYKIDISDMTMANAEIYFEKIEDIVDSVEEAKEDELELLENQFEKEFEDIEKEIVGNIGKENEYEQMLDEKEDALENHFDAIEISLDKIEDLVENLDTVEKYNQFKTEIENFIAENPDYKIDLSGMTQENAFSYFKNLEKIVEKDEDDKEKEIEKLEKEFEKENGIFDDGDDDDDDDDDNDDNDDTDDHDDDDDVDDVDDDDND